jgi:hypothetical protein
MRQYPQIPCDIHNEQATLVLREQPPLYPQVPQTKIINYLVNYYCQDQIEK